MRVTDVVSEAKGAMRASEVFGPPYEKNGVTIIPAAKISGGDVRWQPALDLNRVILMGEVVAIVALLTARAIVQAVVKRR